jgi:predicted nucleic-acid-binding Zn-ribbon protein
MKVNVNHPSFISFLESVSNNILSAIKLEDYFGLTKEKKLSVSFTVLNLLKNSAKVKANLSDVDLKNFIMILCKKNEENENYEFAAVLNDVLSNYDTINDLSSSTKKSTRQKKTTLDPEALE